MDRSYIYYWKYELRESMCFDIDTNHVWEFKIKKWSLVKVSKTVDIFTDDVFYYLNTIYTY